jgi:hypothetical protein
MVSDTCSRDGSSRSSLVSNVMVVATINASSPLVLATDLHRLRRAYYPAAMMLCCIHERNRPPCVALKSNVGEGGIEEGLGSYDLGRRPTGPFPGLGRKAIASLARAKKLYAIAAALANHCVSSGAAKAKGDFFSGEVFCS